MPYLTNRQRINLKQLSIDKGYESAVGTLADEDIFIVHDSSSFDNAPVSGSTVKRYIESARTTNPIFLYDSGMYLDSPADGRARLVSDGTGAKAIELSSSGGFNLHAQHGTIGITGSLVHITSSTNIAKNIMLHANGGVADTILLTSSLGTGAAAIGLLAGAGGITLDAKLDIVLDAGGANVTIQDDGVTTLDIVSNGTTDVTLDAPGDIVLDADGADVIFKDAGTEVGSINMDSSNLSIKSAVSDKDIIFMGSDGGSAITALTLDMSEAGAATFNNKVVATELDISGDCDIDGTTNLDAVDIDGAVQIDGATTFGVDDTGVDVKFFGATSGKFMLFDESRDALAFTDSTKIEVGAGQDMEIYHDGSNSYIANKTGALKLATETSGIAVTIGHSTSEVTIGDNLTVTGDLTVQGTTTTVNQTVVNVQNAFVFEGASADAFETTLSIVDPTADHTYYLPDLGSTGDTGYVMAFSADPGTSGLINATAAELHAVADVSAGASYAEVVDVASDHFLFRDGGVTGDTKVESLADYAEKIAGSGINASAGVLSVGGVKQQIFMSASADGATAVTKGHYILNGAVVQNDYLKLDTEAQAAAAVMSGSSNVSGTPNIQVFLNGMLLRSGSTAFAGESAWVNNSADDYMYVAHTGAGENVGAKATGTVLVLSSSLDPDDVVIVRWLKA